MAEAATSIRATLEALDRDELIELVDVIAANNFVDLGAKTTVYARWRAATRRAEALGRASVAAAAADSDVLAKVSMVAKKVMIPDALMAEWKAATMAHRRAYEKSRAAWAKADRLWTELQEASR